MGRQWGLSLVLLCHRAVGHAFSNVGEKAAVAACVAEQGYGASRIWALTVHKCHLHNAHGVDTSQIQTEGHTNAGFISPVPNAVLLEEGGNCVGVRHFPLHD